MYDSDTVIKFRSNPVDAVIAVTNRCNAQCVMCNIWKIKTNYDLPLAQLASLPTSLKDINISGGEPFLRTDIVEIIEIIRKRCPQARIILSSNGLLSSRILKVMKSVLAIDPRIGIAISVDGKEATHNKIRGTKNASKRVLTTIEGLRYLGMKNVRLAFTATQHNVSDLTHVYDLANTYGLQFTCSIAHDSANYFRVSNNGNIDLIELEKQLSIVAQSELRTFSPKKWFRAFFYKGMLSYGQGKPRLLPCEAGIRSFFLDADGTIYPCNVLSLSMGNLDNSPFENCWNSEASNEVRRKTQACQLNCWMICTARSAIKGSIVKTGTWVLKKKALAHLGRAVLK